MTTTTSQATLTSLVEAFNNHDSAAYASHYTEDAVLEDPFYTQPLRGPEAIEKDIADFFRAFPDARFRTLDILSEGDLLVTRFGVTATHSGPFATPDGGEIAATNRPLSFEGASFARFDGNGKVVEEHRYYDVAGQMAQLGL